MMGRTDKLFFILSYILIIPLIWIDRMTKTWAVASLKGKEPVVLIDKALELQYVENTGAAFGILKDSRIFFLIITFVILLAGTILYIRQFVKNKPHKLLPIVYLLIVSGAVGNLIDRWTNRYVIDFIYVSLIDFPVFNMADIYITVGCVLAVIYVILTGKRDA